MASSKMRHTVAAAGEEPAAATPQPGWMGRRLTPMLEQYVAAKKEVPDALLLFRMGDFYELFFEDAKVAAQELDLTLTARDKSDDPIPMAGVPHHAIDGYIARLVARGFAVALCDQVEDPRQAKGIVKREIVRLVTPGTICDLEALEPGRTSYLAAAVLVQGAPDKVALALLDVLAGELLCTTVERGLRFEDELRRVGVREILLPTMLASEHLASLTRSHIKVVALAHADNNSKIDVPDGHPASQKAWRAAVQAVLDYAESTQRRPLLHVEAARAYHLEEALVLDEATRRSLELTQTQADGRYQGSLLAHLNDTVTALGSRLLARWLVMPLRDRAKMSKRADAVESLKDARTQRQNLRAALRQVRDIERLAGRVALERANPRDVAMLSTSLLALVDVKKIAGALGRTHGLLWHWKNLDILDALAHRMDAALVPEPPVSPNDGGVFKRGHCSELDALNDLCDNAQQKVQALEDQERTQTGINSLKVRYNRVFGFYIEISKAQLKQVPKHYVRRQTLANAERYTTADLSRFEQKVLSAKQQRALREVEMFDALLRELRQHVPQLKRLARAVAATDALGALAQVADDRRYVRPELVDEPILDMADARHPVVEVLCPQGERFVPNSLSMDSCAAQLIVITGPNMAGKSTVMRQAALAVIMAQMGGFVAASRAKVGVCDKLFTRVGAQDMLGRGHSTFMVEMCETAHILRSATKQSLVLLDEVGRGTSTYDGVSIAWAVTEHLHDVIGCRTLFATHYHELTALADSRARIVNARMAVREDKQGITFLRQLEAGGADRSYGLEVARLAQLPQPVLRRARAILEKLESERAGDKKQPAISKSFSSQKENLNASQLNLFEAKPLPARPEQMAAVLALLEKIDCEHTTPFDALTLLGRLQRLAQNAVSSSKANEAVDGRGSRTKKFSDPAPTLSGDLTCSP